MSESNDQSTIEPRTQIETIVASATKALAVTCNLAINQMMRAEGLLAGRTTIQGSTWTEHYHAHEFRIDATIRRRRDGIDITFTSTIKEDRR